MSKLGFFCAALIAVGCCGAAAAQSPAPAPATSAQPAQRDIDPNSLAQGAARALGMIDAGQNAPLWDGASSIAKQSVKREDFVANIQRTRQALGAPTARTWMTVRRQQVPAGQKLPAGLYASVEFATSFQAKTVVEMVSLHQDNDGVWRFTGYVVKQ